MKTAAMIVIGDEVLSGRTRDANMNTLAKIMNDHGIVLREARFIPDDEDIIVSTINEMRMGIDYVFTSGGIGPTHDDITASAVAKAFNVDISIRDDAREILENFYGDDLNPARLRMARIPAGAKLIDNPVSQAPGFQLDNVYVMAGIPMVFNAMLESVRATLVGGAPLKSHSLRIALREGDITDPLATLASQYPNVQIGSYPFFKGSGNGVTLVARATNADILADCVDNMRRMLHELGAKTIFETDL